MTDERFNALVSRLEAQARHSPRGYRFRVLLLALLGVAYVAAVLLLIAALLIVHWHRRCRSRLSRWN